MTTEETVQATQAAETATVAAAEAVGTATADAVTDVKHDVERDTRGLIHRLWDDAETDAAKGLAWFKAEIQKL